MLKSSSNISNLTKADVFQLNLSVINGKLDRSAEAQVLEVFGTR